MADVTKLLKDTAYVGIGLGVLGFQRAQVRRQEMRKQLEAQRKDVERQLGEARTQWVKFVRDLDGRVEPVIEEFEARLDKFEERLPEQARTVVHQARTQAKEARAQVRAQVRNQLTALTGETKTGSKAA